MTDIFISYASLDRPIARRLAEALEAWGWPVWWDHRSLRGGQHFDRIIEEAISSARVVLVVWSQNSIGSDWVRAEAALALDEEKLVPVRIDRVVLPLRFRNIHTVDLSSWTGQTEAEPFETLVETLSDYLGPSSSSKKTEQPDIRSKPGSQAEPTDNAAGLISLGGRKHIGKYFAAFLVSAGVLLGVVVLGGRPQVLPPEPSTEATAANPSASTGDIAAIKAAYERGDYGTALSLARPAADQGDADAQTWVGLMYARGQGVAQDDAEAVRWYRKATDQEFTRAQNNLGVMYRDGRGVAQDDAEALRWYRKAADQGDADAQFNLGVMYLEGRGVAQDDAEALRWYRKAADQGHAWAQNNLGQLSAMGRR